jgi:serine/threonine protein phosphatase PrpC
MEKLMPGAGIKKQMTSNASSAMGEVSALVRKGHEECGDSAFIYLDDDKAILGVFDGVSGEPGAATASSLAATSVLEILRKAKKADEKIIRKAFFEANEAILHGFTTATIAFIQKDGTALVAGVGDSPVYGVTAKGVATLELPLGRAVGDGDSVLKFFYYRNLVTSVLGPSGVDIHIHTRKGKLMKGEMLLLASDCLTDNLKVKVKDGYVIDSSGSVDLTGLIGKPGKLESLVKKLAKELHERLIKGKVEKKNSYLVPKEDDLAVIAFRFK